MIWSKNKTILFSLLFISIIYYLSSSYINTSNDGSHFALVSSLINKHSAIINDYINYTGLIDYAEKNGNYYSDRLPGNAFLMIPFYLIGNLIQVCHLSFISTHVPIQEATVILLPNLCCILAILFIYKTYRFFKIPHITSLILSIIFAFCTLTWQESTHVFSHAPSMFFVLISIYYLFKMPSIDHRYFFYFTVFLSYSSIIELQNLLLFVPCGIYLIIAKKINVKSVKPNLKSLLFAIIIFTSVLSLLLTYNYLAFDEFTLKSNKYNPIFPEEISFLSSLSGNFWVGIDTLFTNFTNLKLYFNLPLGIKNEIPGLLVTSPILMVSIFGFYFFIKKHPKEAYLFISIIILNVLIAAFHKTVLIRHIFTITPFLFFPLVFALQEIQLIKIKKIKILAFTIIAILIMISSIRVYYVTNTYWGRDLTVIFPFKNELGIYGFYILILGIIYYVIRKLFPKINTAIN